MKQELKPKTVREKAIEYPEAYKRQIIEEYLLTGVPKMQLQSKYGIRFKSAIATWMKKLGYVDVYRNNCNLANIKVTELPEKSKNQKAVSSDRALELEIKLLKRQLEDERLRSEMLNRMVDLAEKTYKIPVRKNSNTK
jgi:hypothetical protein